MHTQKCHLSLLNNLLPRCQYLTGFLTFPIYATFHSRHQDHSLNVLVLFILTELNNSILLFKLALLVQDNAWKLSFADKIVAIYAGYMPRMILYWIHLVTTNRIFFSHSMKSPNCSNKLFQLALFFNNFRSSVFVSSEAVMCRHPRACEHMPVTMLWVTFLTWTAHACPLENMPQSAQRLRHVGT